MLTLAEFKPDHLLKMRFQGQDQPLVDRIDQFLEMVAQGASMGPSFACFHGEDLLGVGGLRVFWEGVAEAWLLLCPSANGSAVGLLRAIHSKFGELIDSFGLWRVQASVKTDNLRGVRIMRWLGFASEGIMRGYGPDGSDYFLYAWVRR